MDFLSIARQWADQQATRVARSASFDLGIFDASSPPQLTASAGSDTKLLPVSSSSFVAATPISSPNLRDQSSAMHVTSPSRSQRPSGSPGRGANHSPSRSSINGSNMHASVEVAPALQSRAEPYTEYVGESDNSSFVRNLESQVSALTRQLGDATSRLAAADARCAAYEAAQQEYAATGAALQDQIESLNDKVRLEFENMSVEAEASSQRVADLEAEVRFWQAQCEVVRRDVRAEVTEAVDEAQQEARRLVTTAQEDTRRALEQRDDLNLQLDSLRRDLSAAVSRADSAQADAAVARTEAAAARDMAATAETHLAAQRMETDRLREQLADALTRLAAADAVSVRVSSSGLAPVASVPLPASAPASPDASFLSSTSAQVHQQLMPSATTATAMDAISAVTGHRVSPPTSPPRLAPIAPAASASAPAVTADASFAAAGQARPAQLHGSVDRRVVVALAHPPRPTTLQGDGVVVSQSVDGTASVGVSDRDVSRVCAADAVYCHGGEGLQQQHHLHVDGADVMHGSGVTGQVDVDGHGPHPTVFAEVMPVAAAVARGRSGVVVLAAAPGLDDGDCGPLRSLAAAASSHLFACLASLGQLEAGAVTRSVAVSFLEVDSDAVRDVLDVQHHDGGGLIAPAVPWLDGAAASPLQMPPPAGRCMAVEVDSSSAADVVVDMGCRHVATMRQQGNIRVEGLAACGPEAGALVGRRALVVAFSVSHTPPSSSTFTSRLYLLALACPAHIATAASAGQVPPLPPSVTNAARQESNAATAALQAVSSVWKQLGTLEEASASDDVDHLLHSRQELDATIASNNVTLACGDALRPGCPALFLAMVPTVMQYAVDADAVAFVTAASDIRTAAAAATRWSASSTAPPTRPLVDVDARFSIAVPVPYRQSGSVKGAAGSGARGTVMLPKEGTEDDARRHEHHHSRRRSTGSAATTASSFDGTGTPHYSHTRVGSAPSATAMGTSTMQSGGRSISRSSRSVPAHPSPPQPPSTSINGSYTSLDFSRSLRSTNGNVRRPVSRGRDARDSGQIAHHHAQQLVHPLSQPIVASTQRAKAYDAGRRSASGSHHGAGARSRGRAVDGVSGRQPQPDAFGGYADHGGHTVTSSAGYLSALPASASSSASSSVGLLSDLDAAIAAEVVEGMRLQQQQHTNANTAPRRSVAVPFVTPPSLPPTSVTASSRSSPSLHNQPQQARLPPVNPVPAMRGLLATAATMIHGGLRPASFDTLRAYMAAAAVHAQQASSGDGDSSTAGLDPASFASALCAWLPDLSPAQAGVAMAAMGIGLPDGSNSSNVPIDGMDFADALEALAAGDGYLTGKQR